MLSLSLETREHLYSSQETGELLDLFPEPAGELVFRPRKLENCFLFPGVLRTCSSPTAVFVLVD